MGGHNSKAEQIQFESTEWDEVEKASLFEVMRSKRGQQGNLYHFNVKSQRKLDEEVDLYHKRRSPANWVQVIGANLTSGGFGFCGSQESALVLTERIPLLLSGITRLNKQESLVVLYNALRGFNDISRIIVPAGITDGMIGFTRDGQTKVWINENFGMNYPSHIVEDAKLDEGTVVSNLVNAIAPRAELDAQFANELRNSRSFNTALGLIRSRGGVPENILEANRINVGPYLTRGQVSVLKDTTPLVQPLVQTPVQPLVQPVQYTTGVNSQFAYQPTHQAGYQSWVPPTSTINQGPIGGQSVQYNQTPGFSSNYVSTSSYQPAQYGYQPVRV